MKKIVSFTFSSKFAFAGINHTLNFTVCGGQSRQFQDNNNGDFCWYGTNDRMLSTAFTASRNNWRVLEDTRVTQQFEKSVEEKGDLRLTKFIE